MQIKPYHLLVSVVLTSIEIQLFDVMAHRKWQSILFAHHKFEPNEIMRRHKTNYRQKLEHRINEHKSAAHSW